MSVQKQAEPILFEYGNYRQYLAAYYSHQKATRPQFSFRFFARVAGFASPNFLKLVIDGKRNLTDESIEQFAKALKFNREQTEFFRSLVHLNQATTGEGRRFWAESLLRSQVYRKLHPLKPAQHAYYSRWYHVPVRELVGLPGFKEDTEWISRALVPQISQSEAKQALQTLLDLGLIERGADGKLRQTQAFLSTGDEVDSAHVKEFHQGMIELGGQAIDRFPSSERDISALTLGVSEKGAKAVKELVQKFRKELLAIAQAEDQPTRVLELNLQLFPVAIPQKEGK